MNSPLFPNLPSVNDLLQSEPLRYLTERLSRNVVVDGVRAFLSRLQFEVATAARDLELPSASELAARIAEWLRQEESAAPRPAINATGFILSDLVQGPPWADAALARWHSLGRGYSQSPRSVAEEAEAVGTRAARLVGAQAGLVVNSHAGALALVLSGLAPQAEATIARSDITSVEPGRTLADLAAGCGVRLREVGSVSQTTVADYQAGLPAQQGLLLLARRSDMPTVGMSPGLADLVAMARAQGAVTVVDAGKAALADLASLDLPSTWGVSILLQAGADAVVLCGEGLIGGPPCGLIVGSTAAIARVSSSSFAPLARPDRASLSALAVAIDLTALPAKSREEVPALALAATSLDNLEFRARRLALQLAALPGIAAAEVRRGETWLTPARRTSDRLDTWQILLSAQAEPTERFTARLRSGSPAIVALASPEGLVLDMRSVLPREDIELMRSFERLMEASNTSVPQDENRG